MKYPTIEFVHQVHDASDFECLKRWHDELPTPVTGKQHHVMHEIEKALVALGQIQASDCRETEEVAPLFEMGGEG